MASFWAAFGLPFGSLWLLLASIGAHLGHPWLPFWTFRTPSRALSAPWTTLGGVFPHPGPPLGPILASFGRFWAPLGLSLDPLGVLARLSPDECWRVPAESKRILRNRLVIIEGHLHLIFSKVSNSRLPQQAEFKKQGGRRCVARRASSIIVFLKFRARL